MRTASLLLAVLLSTSLTPVLAAEQAADPLKDLLPDSYGNAFGRIYDAETGVPIPDATVIVQDQGQFPEKGQTVGRTDKSGQYRCGAKIGKYRSKVDVGRVLFSGLAGLIAGSAKKQTKDVMVTELPIRVVKDGYQTFEGLVPCKLITAEKFQVDLAPVLLTKMGAATISTAAKGWGAARVLSVSLQPAVAAPRDKVVVTAQLQAPKGELAPIRVECTSKSLGRGTLSPSDKKAEGLVTYAATFAVSKHAKAGAETVQVAVTSSAYDIGPQASASTMFQVATNAGEREAAVFRTEAYTEEVAGHTAQAVLVLKDLCALPAAMAEDHAWLGRLSEQLHDYPTATAAWKKTLDLTPEKERLGVAGGYANALVQAGDQAKVLTDVLPLLTGIKRQDYPKRIRADLAVGIATAYLRIGDLAKADEWHKDIVTWKGTSNLPGLAALRQELRLAQAEEKLKANPTDPQALLARGRVLMDTGHWSEAIDDINRALALKPDLQAARWDLGYALLHVQGGDQQVAQNFDAALAEAEHDSQPDPKTKSKDFFVWHRLGLLLYRKASQQQAAADPQAADTLAKSRAALAEGLRLARYTKRTDSYNWFYGYTTPQVNATAGWEYPEAEADFTLLAGLQAVTQRPDDYLAHFSVASALVDLGQADLAEATIRRTAELQPAFAEVRYPAARLALRKSDVVGAKQELAKLLQVNPRHPQANLDLAKLYTEDGDMPAAAACLAEYAKYYGKQ